MTFQAELSKLTPLPGDVVIVRAPMGSIDQKQSLEILASIRAACPMASTLIVSDAVRFEILRPTMTSPKEPTV